MSGSRRDVVASALESLSNPPADIVSAADQGEWYSVITARDGTVVWRFVCERSVWRLEAAPNWAPKESFDADLLARHFLGRSIARPTSDLSELMRISVEDLIEELQLLRDIVIAAFRPDTWSVLRTALMKTGHQRDSELYGRPIPPGVA